MSIKLKDFLNEELLTKEADKIVDKIIKKMEKVKVPILQGKKLRLARAFKIDINGKKVTVGFYPKSMMGLAKGADGQYYGDSSSKINNIIVTNLSNLGNVNRFKTTLYHEIVHFLEGEKGRLFKTKPGKNYWKEPTEINSFIHELHLMSKENNKEWNNIRNIKEFSTFLIRYMGGFGSELLKNKNFTQKILKRISRENFLPKNFQKPHLSKEKEKSKKTLTKDEMVMMIKTLPMSKREKKQALENILKMKGKNEKTNTTN